jgi:CelD/BcsL family acetyltransferase involved in cellulose biosynthesis
MERFVVTAVEDPRQLLEHAAAWQDLAAASIEPNPFYEPWMLLPAIAAFGTGVPLVFVFVHVQTLGKSHFAGFFPLERCSHYRHVPVSYLRLWKHRHCFVRTPLLLRRHARGGLAAFLDWLDRRDVAMMEWDAVCADGPFYRLLTDVLDESGRASFLAYRFERALLRRRANAAAYLNEVLPGRRRKEFRRLERRLGECGALRYDALQPGAAAHGWIDEFMQLEASGWKGQRGSALRCSDHGKRFFIQAASAAARRGRLMMLALRLNDRAVAMKCNFLADDGGYAFKIAHDEAYGHYSPGALLELEHIRQFHLRPQLRWVDSCADPDHFMANHLWLDRCSIAKLITATRRATGKLLVSSMPFLQRLANGVRARLAA